MCTVESVGLFLRGNMWNPICTCYESLGLCLLKSIVSSQNCRILDLSGWSWGRGNRGDLCLSYIPFSYWQESAYSSVGERTCIQRRRRREKLWSDGRRRRGRDEMTACQASNLREVLVVEPKRFHCSKNCLISLFVCACLRLMLVLNVFLCRKDRVDLCFCLPFGLRLNWMSSVADSLLTTEPINKICCSKHL